jgi:hypothetical protein
VTPTTRFSALGCNVRVLAGTDQIGEYVARLFRHLDAPLEAVREHCYEVAAGANGGVVVTSESTAVGSTIQALVRAIDQHLIDASPRLLVHAAAVCRGNRSLALPAQSGKGKSTLVAGLVRSGLAYVTDEFVSPDWDTTEVQPYQRFITLHPDSRPLFSDRPTIADELGGAVDGHWQVDPEDVRRGSVADGLTRLGALVFPMFIHGEGAALEPMSRADALLALSECTFHFHRHGARAFELLGRIVNDCESYRLTFGDLDSACAAVAEVDP